MGDGQDLALPGVPPKHPFQQLGEWQVGEHYTTSRGVKTVYCTYKVASLRA